MHAIAEQWPDAVIEFRFYDDREDILHTLIALFEANCAFIPENIDLKLLHFDGNNLNSLLDVKEKAVIIGTSKAYKRMSGECRELARRLGQALHPKEEYGWHKSIIGRYNKLYCDIVRSHIRSNALTVNELSLLQVDFNNWLSSHSLRPADNLTCWSQNVSGLLGGTVFHSERVPHTVARLMHRIEHIQGVIPSFSLFWLWLQTFVSHEYCIAMALHSFAHTYHHRMNQLHSAQHLGSPQANL